MTNPRHQEWLNLNSVRNYPIKEGLSRKDSTDTFEFPNGLILDAVFSVPDVNTMFYVKDLMLYESNIIFNIYDTGDVFVGAVNINTATHKQYDRYIVAGHGDYKNVQGKVVIGDIDLLNATGLGKFTFAKETTTFEDTVLVPLLRGVSSISILNNETLLIGDVKLTAGFNCRLRINNQENAIYIDAIEGHGLGEVCQCEEEEDRTCVEMFNGIRPNVDGNFDFRGIDCIAVEAGSNSLKILNTCQDVCCDCDDVNALLASLSGKQDQLDDLTQRVLVLENC